MTMTQATPLPAQSLFVAKSPNQRAFSNTTKDTFNRKLIQHYGFELASNIQDALLNVVQAGNPIQNKSLKELWGPGNRNVIAELNTIGGF